MQNEIHVTWTPIKMGYSIQEHFNKQNAVGDTTVTPYLPKDLTTILLKLLT